MLVALALVVWALPARAHTPTQSLVALDMRRAGVLAELRLPLSELENALKHPMKGDAEHVAALYGPELTSYIGANVTGKARDGRPWAVTVRDVTAENDPNGGVLVAHVWLEPPAGASPRAFTLGYDVITHEIVNHIAFVSIRSDWQNAVFSNRPELLGTIRYQRKWVLIDRAEGSEWRGFRGVVELGEQHIAEGTDHLLFLLMLLLPAPLLVKGARWGGSGGARYGARRLLLTVTAFTFGHSLTLIAGAVGWLRLPAQPVEILIAASIFVSAVHAVRPLFPGREPWVAAGFGLVHGLAFAGAIAELALDPLRLSLAILGFNLGIELMQLVVVVSTAPWLMLLARTLAYPFVRVGGALFGGVCALAWIAQRAFGWDNPLDAVVMDLAHRGPVFVAALATVAVAATFAQRAWDQSLERLALTRIDQVYDLLEATMGEESRANVAAITKELPGPLAARVAKALFLHQHAKSVRATRESLAAILCPDAPEAEAVAAVEEALRALEARGLVRREEDGYVIAP